MDGLLQFTGGLVARAHAAYGLFLLVTTYLFVNVAVLGAAAWALAMHAGGRTPWPWLPAGVRRGLRFAVELAFGFINPVLYLVVLQPFIPELRASGGAWHGLLTAGAWGLLMVFWVVRLFGAAVEWGGQVQRRTVLAVLAAACTWLLAYIVKDTWSLWPMAPSNAAPISTAINLLRGAPLYLVPGVLLWDYIRLASTSVQRADGYGGFFLLKGRTARAALVGAAALALLTTGLSAHHRSDANVRAIIATHHEAIRDAGWRFGVDPKLIASIVYVTHRDELSPFRDELERICVSAWARNMRAEIGIGPPDNVDRVGTDENPILNRLLDVSVGLAQIKPRTAQAASVLATGRLPDELPPPDGRAYRDIEPLGSAWDLPPTRRLNVDSPIPVSAPREAVAAALLDDSVNLTTCALILALYQHQWEASNPDWSLRDRPEILATLYQLGFARSRPHAAPGSNAFGRRVREVLEQPWLDALGFRPRAQHAQRTGFPAHWWAEVPKAGAPEWEVLPQEAGPDEVIVSKRHELGLLSNFAATPFSLRGKPYASVEGFWQMMLYPEGPADPRAVYPGLTWAYTRDRVAQLTSFEAKHAGELAEQNMARMGIGWVSFEGRRFEYRPAHPGEHYALIVEAMRAKVGQNPDVRRVLLATGDLVLRPDHREEPNAAAAWRYCDILMRLRAELRRSGG